MDLHRRAERGEDGRREDGRSRRGEAARGPREDGRDQRLRRTRSRRSSRRKSAPSRAGPAGRRTMPCGSRRKPPDIELTTNAPSGPPDPMKPAFELYGEMLLESNRAAGSRRGLLAGAAANAEADAVAPRPGARERQGRKHHGCAAALLDAGHDARRRADVAGRRRSAEVPEDGGDRDGKAVKRSHEGTKARTKRFFVFLVLSWRLCSRYRGSWVRSPTGVSFWPRSPRRFVASTLEARTVEAGVVRSARRARGFSRRRRGALPRLRLHHADADTRRRGRHGVCREQGPPADSARRHAAADRSGARAVRAADRRLARRGRLPLRDERRREHRRARRSA